MPRTASVREQGNTEFRRIQNPLRQKEFMPLLIFAPPVAQNWYMRMNFLN